MNARRAQTCKHHGLTGYVQETEVRWRCVKCRSEAVQRRRHKLKQQAVEYKGGKCEECGYDRCIEALEFHHRAPAQKDFAIGGKGYTRSWDKIRAELDKCDMLCSNCHREKHAGII